MKKSLFHTEVDEVIPVDTAGEYARATARAVASGVNTTVGAFRRNAPTIGRGVRATARIIGTIVITAISWGVWGLGKAADAIEATHQDNQSEEPLPEEHPRPFPIKEVS